MYYIATLALLVGMAAWLGYMTGYHRAVRTERIIADWDRTVLSWRQSETEDADTILLDKMGRSATYGKLAYTTPSMLDDAFQRSLDRRYR